ncbi:MAG: hypothetical protein J6C87_00220 [Bacteroides sp.]|nr:hypothetical protein [Bacteroides sp.]
MATISVSTRTANVAFLGEEKVLTSVERLPNILWEQLLEYASNNSGISKSMMSAAVYALENEIQQWIFNGHGIQLGNLGYLYISTSAKAKDTVDEAGAEAVYRLSVKFRQSSKLRNLLNTNVSLQTIGATTSTSTDDTTNPDSGNTNTGGSTDEGVGIE